MQRTLWVDHHGRLLTIDQTRLPFEVVALELTGRRDCSVAIRTMQVRGAPLIGAVGAYGLAFALQESAADTAIAAAYAELLAARPTAVNLRWALDRVKARVLPLRQPLRADAAWQEAAAICDDDVACNQAIGEHGARLLAPVLGQAQRAGRALQVLTHCNAGGLATVGYGTALAPIYALHRQAPPVHVWVDETRPRNQGASLTAWELGRAGIPHTIVADNSGGLLMMQGRIDAVIVGCDRVAANGDVANKIGTYLKALAAREHKVPFYVACPISSIDARVARGADIPIEERAAREVTHITGRNHAGSIVEVQIAPDGSAAANPGFDITPAALVTGLITERGECQASTQGMRALCPELFAPA